jgi:predicted transcriptional regulator
MGGPTAKSPGARSILTCLIRRKIGDRGAPEKLGTVPSQPSPFKNNTRDETRAVVGQNAKYQIRRDVYIEWEILESEAFKQLSATGIRVLLRFLQKRTWTKARRKGKKPDYNNGGLAFTYAEAEALDISTSQFHTIIKKLVEVGFLEVEHQGGIHKNDYSRYALSERWRAYGTDAFKAVEKKRVLWKGHDVRSWMEIKDTTENRSEPLRETVAIERI